MIACCFTLGAYHCFFISPFFLVSVNLLNHFYGLYSVALHDYYSTLHSNCLGKHTEDGKT